MTTLYSPRWHRVSALRPRLLPQLRVVRQWVRGERWRVLSDPLGGRSVRLNAAAWAVAGRLDGRHPVQQLWESQWRGEAEPMSQDELIDLLARLREAGLVQFDRAADFDLLLPHLDGVARPKGRGSLLAWRLPVGNPSALLDLLRPLQGLLFSRGAFALWLLGVAALLLQAAQHAPALWAHGVQWMATPRYALLAMLLYVPIKLLHELAHGLAVRRWGGRVREAGVTLMLGMPVPYVDASAAAAFTRRRERIAVGAAGIACELALAAMALPLWLWLPDGLARDLAFVTLFITGVSTLLFNANPLQRLDGYYIAVDLLSLPNLAARSRDWWQDVLRRRLLGVQGGEPMVLARGEAAWLAAYAPLSWAWGLVIATLAAAWLGQVSFVLGLVCAGLLGWQMLLRPAWRLAGTLRRVALLQSGSTRRWRVLALGAAALAVLLMALPLPQRSLVQGVVWPSDLAQLRADEEGFVESVHVRDGESVHAGTLVLQLANPRLQAALARQAARVAALETELFQALPGRAHAGEESRAGDVHAELAAAQAELERLTERSAALALRARVAGRIALPEAADLPGQYVAQGRLLGQVLTGEAPTVRVALPESQASELRREGQALGVRLAGSPGLTHAAELLRDGVGAVLQLPSAALSTRHGGDVPTDPKDTQDLKPLQPVVLLDVRLSTPSGRDGAIGGPDATSAAPGSATGARLGERAWVRFDAGFAPAGWQLMQGLRREILRRFNPQH